MERNTPLRQKKSQKRADRQARKAEKRKRLELFQKHEQKAVDEKPIRIRLSKKSLPAFLAKNVDAIITWLKEYQVLFCLADDYGIRRLDRLSENKRALLVDNYAKIGDFIIKVNEILNKCYTDENQTATECRIELPADIDAAETACTGYPGDGDDMQSDQPTPNDSFNDVAEFVESLQCIGQDGEIKTGNE